MKLKIPDNFLKISLSVKCPMVLKMNPNKLNIEIILLKCDHPNKL